MIKWESPSGKYYSIIYNYVKFEYVHLIAVLPVIDSAPSVLTMDASNWPKVALMKWVKCLWTAGELAQSFAQGLDINTVPMYISKDAKPWNETQPVIKQRTKKQLQWINEMTRRSQHIYFNVTTNSFLKFIFSFFRLFCRMKIWFFFRVDSPMRPTKVQRRQLMVGVATTDSSRRRLTAFGRSTPQFTTSDSFSLTFFI